MEIFRVNMFFAEICRMEQTVFETQEDGKISAYSAYLRTNRRPGVVLVAPISTYGKHETAVKYLLYTIKREKLDVQFGVEEEESCWVMRYNGQILYAPETWNPKSEWNEKNGRSVKLGKVLCFSDGFGL